MIDAAFKPPLALPESAFHLLPDKALLWRTSKTLIVSDIHIGKAAHFRKNGIALPKAVNSENLWRLANLLLDTQASRLLILGDLVHSAHNQEWEQFVDFRANFPHLEVVLVRGNHDILPDHHYQNAEINCVTELYEDGFYFTHDPASDRREQNLTSENYHLCGHLHPAVLLRGTARQAMRLPCFWFGIHHGVLPAFGSFTGTKTIRAEKQDRVYAIGAGKVFSV